MILLILIFIYIAVIKEYKRTTYYETTKNSFLAVRTDAGKLGEYNIYRELKDYEYKVKFLFNLYMPKENGETTEIDVVVISTKGILVFESKNYSGWIFGSENSQMWTQTFPRGRYGSQKFKFFNPIIQNKIHIDNLKKLTGEDIPFYSLIVFSGSSELKQVPNNTEHTKVLKDQFIKDIFKEIYINHEDIIDLDKVYEIYLLLYPYTQVSTDIKNKHIENIRNKFNNV